LVFVCSRQPGRQTTIVGSSGETLGVLITAASSGNVTCREHFGELRFHKALLPDKLIAIPDEAIGQKIWREIGELCRQADRSLHLADVAKYIGIWLSATPLFLSTVSIELKCVSRTGVSAWISDRRNGMGHAKTTLSEPVVVGAAITEALGQRGVRAFIANRRCPNAPDALELRMPHLD
jgi:hypothetical protein